MSSEPSRLPTLLVFADDWGRYPSSCQHLVRHLLDRYQVVWVNTIGTRKPRLDLNTVRRGWEKVRHWLAPAHGSNSFPVNLQVLNPKMWPRFTLFFDRWLNRRLLRRQLEPVLRSLPGPVVAVTTLPIVADLVGVLSVQRWIYYCVDDFSEWPGLDGSTLRGLEEELVRGVDSAIAVSETLQERLGGMGRTASLLTHGVDLDYWQATPATATLPGLEELERPLVVFWGMLDRRMDVAFVQRLARELKRGTILLAGPEADPDPRLFKISRVVRLGSVPFELLPPLARAAAVLIMPYADLPVTRAMQPLKLKEYLATGLPVVARGLPSVGPWADCLDVADSPEDFARAVCLRLVEGVPTQQRVARARLVGESWAEKALTFERLALACSSSLNPACCL